nr:hypothetical protein [Tanacetum cinerariifolium]
MDDPNITMEEYTRLEEEKARRHGRTFNWQTATFGDRLIPDKGDLRDYWIEISSGREFLGPALSYVLIRDPMRRLCHKMIAYNISGRGHAPEKVTGVDLFYLRSMDLLPPLPLAITTCCLPPCLLYTTTPVASKRFLCKLGKNVANGGLVAGGQNQMDWYGIMARKTITAKDTHKTLKDHKSSGKSSVFSDMRIGEKNEELDKKIMRPKLEMRGVIGDGTGRRNETKTMTGERRKRDGFLKEITLQGQLRDQIMVLDQEDLLPHRNKGLESSQRMSKRFLTKLVPSKRRRWYLRGNVARILVVSRKRVHPISAEKCAASRTGKSKEAVLLIFECSQIRALEASSQKEKCVFIYFQGFSYPLENKEVVVHEKNDDNDDGEKENAEEEVIT